MSHGEEGEGKRRLADAYRIDAACDAFEAKWQSNQSPPRIEDFLGLVPDADRTLLLHELLAVDLDYRGRHHYPTAAAQFLERFPEISAAEIETIIARAENISGQADSLSQAGLTVGSNFGDFEIVEMIGTGGMGAVYLAGQESGQLLVALKVIRAERLDAEADGSRSSAVDRFHTEAQAAAQLDRPGIVTVYETGEIDGRHYLAMRYVAGRSLSQLMVDGPLENRRAAGYMVAVARAVSAAHEKGVLHRDLKPQNILIENDTDLPWVADFGLAKLQESAPELTHMGDILGTPQYMSPEQAEDSASVTSAADVYAMGATLYNLLTGRPPFQAANALQTVQQVLHDEPISPRRLNPGIDLGLETICLKSISKATGQRYLSANDLADDLQRYLDHLPIKARRIGAVGIASRWCRRNPVVAALSLTISLSLLALLSASTIGYVTTSAARTVSEEGFRDARLTIDRIVTRVSEEGRQSQQSI